MCALSAAGDDLLAMESKHPAHVAEKIREPCSPRSESPRLWCGFDCSLLEAWPILEDDLASVFNIPAHAESSTDRSTNKLFIPRFESSKGLRLAATQSIPPARGGLPPTRKTHPAPFGDVEEGEAECYRESAIAGEG